MCFSSFLKTPVPDGEFSPSFDLTDLTPEIHCPLFKDTTMQETCDERRKAFSGNAACEFCQASHKGGLNANP
ncbi:MAG TPA: hypothetical protein VGK71_05100 [Nitrospirota bacterium]|jgi:hypothetical protein